MVLEISSLIHKIFNRHMDIVQYLKRARKAGSTPQFKPGLTGRSTASPAASFNE